MKLMFNIDLYGWERRTSWIQAFMNDINEPFPDAIEIYLVPADYTRAASEHVFPSPAAGSTKRVLTNLGHKLKLWDLDTLFVHYPWQMSVVENQGRAFQSTVKWADELIQLADIETCVINQHFVTTWLDFEMLREYQVTSFRDNLMVLAEWQLRLAKRWTNQINPEIQLTIENNPTAAISTDVCGNTGADILDLATEDYKYRLGHNGFCLDIGHAASVIQYFIDVRHGKQLENVELTRKSYDGIPSSCMSLEGFIGSLGNKIRYLHLADIDTGFKHQGLEIGTGLIDWEHVIELTQKYCPDRYATLEMEDAHTTYGFDKVKRSYMYLKKRFEE